MFLRAAYGRSSEIGRIFRARGNQTTRSFAHFVSTTKTQFVNMDAIASMHVQGTTISLVERDVSSGNRDARINHLVFSDSETASRWAFNASNHDEIILCRAQSHKITQMGMERIMHL